MLKVTLEPNKFHTKLDLWVCILTFIIFRRHPDSSPFHVFSPSGCGLDLSIRYRTLGLYAGVLFCFKVVPDRPPYGLQRKEATE